MCFLRDWINALFAEKYQLINLCNKILASDMENPCRRLILYVIALPHSVVSKCAFVGCYISLPLGGRWHGVDVTEGARVTFRLNQIYRNALSLSLAFAHQLPPGGSLWL